MLNKAIFEGHLGADPELRTTPTGVQCCIFRVGVARNYKDESGKAPTDWISCVAWRSTAEHISKYYHKGSPILVEGAISSRTYQDKDSGKNVYVTEITVDKVYFALGGKKESAPLPTPPPELSAATQSNAASSTASNPLGSPADFAATDDDYPF